MPIFVMGLVILPTIYPLLKDRLHVLYMDQKDNSVQTVYIFLTHSAADKIFEAAFIFCFRCCC